MYKSSRQDFYYNNISCNSNSVIATISRHIENPDIVRTVYSGIFRHIQGHSAIFSHAQAYWGTLGHTEAYSGVIEAYEAINVGNG